MPNSSSSQSSTDREEADGDADNAMPRRKNKMPRQRHAPRCMCSCGCSRQAWHRTQCRWCNRPVVADCCVDKYHRDSCHECADKWHREQNGEYSPPRGWYDPAIHCWVSDGEGDDDPEDRRTCFLCSTRRRAIRFQCGHCTACEECADEMTACPHCMEVIRSKLRFDGPEGNALDYLRRTFSAPHRPRCFLCENPATRHFFCPDCRRRRPNWYLICAHCVGKFRCMCGHRAVDDDVSPITDDEVEGDPSARGSNDPPVRQR